ncbi:hypothetical protein E4T44_04114 [Aureobasidium sp. EXF-8845]|nr:hypothetical protein E4T44_04114 [Aureobasidium sp. EXF-8845]KAI4854071.1 hypothetical protein E4T45_04099 [Aureobasidium sp. EXF-8846]
MADGLNEARATRIAEILSDFRNLQYHIASIIGNSLAEGYYYYEEGYVTLRECAAEAQALLQQEFDSKASAPDGDQEEEKAQLQSVIIDASIRRFKAKQIYLKADAAL